MKSRAVSTGVLTGLVFSFLFASAPPAYSADGNERMSWLLTLLLLNRSGYYIGQYISIEKLIEESADTYMEALRASANGWHDSTNDYLPFVQYYLGILLKAYREFFSRMDYFADETMTKPQRVEKILRTHLGKMTMEEIRNKCPDISYSTATKTLNSLIAEGKVLKIGGGRYSAYIYNANS
jgi:Fic family protein